MPESEKERLKAALKEEGLEPASFFSIIKENSHEWLYLLLALGGTLIRGASRPVYSLVYGFIFRDFTLQGPALNEAVNFWVVIFIIIGVVQTLGTVAGCFFFGLTSERLACRLRMKVFRNVLRQHVGYFDDPKHSTGKITTRLATDAPNVKAAMDYRLSDVIATFIYMFGGWLVALSLGWQLALLGIALLPVMGVASFLLEKLRGAAQHEDARMMEEAGNTSSEAIQNIRTVQALTREKSFYRTFCKQLLPPYNHGLRKAHIHGITHGLRDDSKIAASKIQYSY